MKKIISLFKRNYETDHLVRNEVVEGAEWVINGEGVATRKYDGTCCLIANGELFKRYELKPGKTPPEGFISVTEKDGVTGKVQGWVPVGLGNEDKYHREAFDNLKGRLDGTYELVGPKIQGGIEAEYTTHTLVKHSMADVIDGFPRDFDGIKDYFSNFPYEGVVFHRDNGEMVKIKVKDFHKKK